MKKVTQLMGWSVAVVLAGQLWACSPAAPATVAPPSPTRPAPTAALASATPPPPTPTEPGPAATPSATPTDTGSTPTEPAPTATPQLQPTPDAEAAGRRLRLPILMYHYIEPWPAGADEVRQGLTVTPEDFQAQMAYLHDQGYVTVSLYDLMAALTLGTALPEKAVVLTFDDGYRTLLDYAVPVMEAYGFTGTVFAITQFMDEERPEYLTWDQAEALYAQGWKIEPHTKTHDNLKGRGRDFQLYQMLGSVQTVEAHIGVMPRFLAYPAGQFDELSVALVEEMHLWGAVTTISGRVHAFRDRYTLTRVRMSGTGVMQDFLNGLEGGD